MVQPLTTTTTTTTPLGLLLMLVGERIVAGNGMTHGGVLELVLTAVNGPVSSHDRSSRQQPRLVACLVALVIESK